MIIAVASFKGGVGKTTTAIHLAAYFQTHANTLLIDADPNRSSSAWAARGSLPFDVVDAWSPARMTHYSHVIIDTQARPIPEDLAMIADTCELILLPTTPDILSLEALTLTLEQLHAVEARRYRVLITIIPPKPSKDGEQTRELLTQSGIPVCESGIRRLAAFHKAATAGTLIYDVRDPRSHLGWDDYQSVGAELLGMSTAGPLTGAGLPTHDSPNRDSSGPNHHLKETPWSQLSSKRANADSSSPANTQSHPSQHPDLYETSRQEDEPDQVDQDKDDLNYYDPPDTIEF